MFLDGFHITTHRGHVGKRVAPGEVEDAGRIEPRVRDAWRYHEALPTRITADRFFYGYDDIVSLTGWEHSEVKRKARMHKWRSRMDNTTKRREFYLYDLLVTVWTYMRDWEGNKLDPDLIIDAEDWQRDSA